jgi:hypothetical protein
VQIDHLTQHSGLGSLRIDDNAHRNLPRGRLGGSR